MEHIAERFFQGTKVFGLTSYDCTYFKDFTPILRLFRVSGNFAQISYKYIFKTEENVAQAKL